MISKHNTILSPSLYIQLSFIKYIIVIFLIFSLYVFFPLSPVVKLILFCLFSSLYISCSKGTVSLPKNVFISAVKAFGDSVVDQGNNNYINTMTKANFRPYGKDFMDGKPTGWFSNGKTLADVFGTFFYFFLKSLIRLTKLDNIYIH